MAEAKARNDWAHTSCVLAMLANTHRDPKKGRARKPSDFNPFEKGSKTGNGVPLNDGGLDMLKAMFKGKKPRRRRK